MQVQVTTVFGRFNPQIRIRNESMAMSNNSTRFIQTVFSEVTSTYELVNQILADIIREASFEEFGFQKLLFGVAAIHHAKKRGNRA